MFEGLTQRFNGVFNRIRGRGKITEDEFHRIVEVSRELQSLPLYIDGEWYRSNRPGYESHANYRFSPALKYRRRPDSPCLTLIEESFLTFAAVLKASNFPKNLGGLVFPMRTSPPLTSASG